MVLVAGVGVVDGSLSTSIMRLFLARLHVPSSCSRSKLSVRPFASSSSSSSISLDDQFPHTHRPKWNKFPDGSRFWKNMPETGRKQRPIFVAATKQHVGKTTTSLAIMKGLQQRYERVGFVKPVGQQHVEVHSSQNEILKVDKDCVLVKEHFQLDHIDYKDMSPVIIPRGYTKAYIRGEVSLAKQIQDVENAMANMTKASDIVLCEGTGHCAVGSIVGLNNAKVASIIGADMVLVANGGLGSAFDELELNRVLCQKYNVRIAGVVINKVIPDKLEQTEKYMRQAMLHDWGVPLLGCIPDNPYLGKPALADLEVLFGTKLICGEEHRFRHYSPHDINVVTTSLTRFLENLREKPPRTLYLCHVTRDELILGFLGEFQRRRDMSENPFEAALIICGRKGRYQLSKEIEDILSSAKGIPIMVVPYATYDVTQKISSYTPKLNIHDKERSIVAAEHYLPYLDMDELIRRTSSGNTTGSSSFDEPGSFTRPSSSS